MNTFKTDDGYTIQEGTEIYYTGDMANHEAWRTVIKIEPCSFYRWRVTLKDNETGKLSYLTPTSFDKGVGRRFIPKKLYDELRAQRLNILFANR